MIMFPSISIETIFFKSGDILQTETLALCPLMSKNEVFFKLVRSNNNTLVSLPQLTKYFPYKSKYSAGFLCPVNYK